MATPVALAKRREEAAGRIAASLEALGQQFGLAVDETALTGRGRDADQARTRQMEAFADTLEQVVMLTTPEDVPETATPLVIDGVKPEHLDALAATGIMTLDDLRDASDDMILSAKGIGPATLERIRAHLATLEP